MKGAGCFLNAGAPRPSAPQDWSTQERWAQGEQRGHQVGRGWRWLAADLSARVGHTLLSDWAAETFPDMQVFRLACG